MRTSLLSLGLALALAVVAPADDLSPEVRDFLNSRFQQIQACRTDDEVRTVVKAILDEATVWDRSGFNADEGREAEAFFLEVEATGYMVLHRSQPVPALLPTPLADGLLQSLKNGPPLTTPDDVDRWIRFLEAVPTILDQSAAFLKEKEAQGQPYPRLVLTQIASSLDAYFWSPPAFGPIAQFFAGEVADPVLRERVANILETKVYPGLKAVRKAIDDLASRAPTTYTLCVDPESYAAIIFDRLGERVPASDLHAGALDNLKELEQEVDFLLPGSGSAFARVLAYLRTEPVLLTEDLPWAQQVLDDSPRLMAPWFSAPAPRFETRFQTTDPVSNYAPESLDGHRPARLNLSRGNLAKGSSALRLLWHEGLPGHAYQIGLQRGDITLPLFRLDPWPSAFVEGWAVYAESLMSETTQGRDPFYQATHWMLRYNAAVAVALDTGINALGWTYKDAQAFLRRVRPGDTRSYEVSINRVIYWPGQLLAYDYGYRKLCTLRDEVKAAEGERFDLKRFPDRLLALGAHPFPLIRRVFFPTLTP